LQVATSLEWDIFKHIVGIIRLVISNRCCPCTTQTWLCVCFEPHYTFTATSGIGGVLSKTVSLTLSHAF